MVKIIRIRKSVIQTLAKGVRKFDLIYKFNDRRRNSRFKLLTIFELKPEE